jgi:hypothetical protein
MKVIRNGEVWFSTLEEALSHARRQKAAPTDEISAAYAGFIRAGAIAIVGWKALQSLALGAAIRR